MLTKLTELIKEAMQYADLRKDIGDLYKPYEEYIAEYLLDNGVGVSEDVGTDKKYRYFISYFYKDETKKSIQRGYGHSVAVFSAPITSENFESFVEAMKKLTKSNEITILNYKEMDR